jgi:pre-rRNA-processing protein TSR4
MVLLLQLNGDLPEHFPGHERRLYVLTCRRKTCRRKEGSVRAIRGTRINEAAAKDIKKEVKKEDKPVQPVAKVVESKGLGESLFGAKPLLGTAGSNPFSASSTGAKPANPFASPSTAPNNPFSASNLSELAAKPPQNPTTTTTTAENLPKTFAAALSLNNTRAKPEMFGPIPPPEPWPQDSDLPAPYPSYYIADADYETLDKEDAPVPQAIMMDVDDGSTGGGGGKEDTEIYESTIDKTFQKFADRLAQNPEQVIRYEFRGAPLVYSKTDAVGRLLSSPQSGSSKITTTRGR